MYHLNVLIEKGSIPAHAGEPSVRKAHLPAPSVYPRPRGGTHNPHAARPLHEWSIPAHAGEPPAGGRSCCGTKVYPRPRGGTSLRESDDDARDGLSPPTRGNRRRPARVGARGRSIPAHAGEPQGRPAVDVARTVYPRPRGGTLCERCRRGKTGGLSPPTRGNQEDSHDDHREKRSIPAHAGEPPWGLHGRGSGGVYPRPRGGTAMITSTSSSMKGLSPPTRGNRRPCHPCRRSIPAHAGEPPRQPVPPEASPVYPRPRGGTARRKASSMA